MLFDSSKAEYLNPTLGSLTGGLVGFGFFTVGFVFVFFLIYVFTYFKTVLSKVTHCIG